MNKEFSIDFSQYPGQVKSTDKLLIEDSDTGVEYWATIDQITTPLTNQIQALTTIVNTKSQVYITQLPPSKMNNGDKWINPISLIEYTYIDGTLIVLNSQQNGSNIIDGNTSHHYILDGNIATSPTDIVDGNNLYEYTY